MDEWILDAAVLTLILATRNLHKAAEIRTILGEDFRLLTMRDFPDAPAGKEDAGSFAGNATAKAVELARWLARRPERAGSATQSLVLADDSGLEVDSLGGAPGVHSARFAALEAQDPANAPDQANNQKLLELLRDVPREHRTARFRCVLALTPVLGERTASASPVCAADEHEWQTELFEGICEGRIRFEAKGAGGFGYDPLFVPEGFEASFAELGEGVKNRISHRARALAKLRRRLEGGTR